jgi:tRNA uridine 5-carbamoylmethylation protein Kti12
MLSILITAKDNRNFVIKKLKYNRTNYIVKAIVFNHGGTGMEDTIIGLNKKRNIELAKTGRERPMSENTLKSFIKRYEEPSTETENIDEVEFIDNRKDLENYVNEKNISNFVLNKKIKYYE